MIKVCHDAAMGPIRELGLAAIRTVQADQVREVAIQVSLSNQ
jgi:hypothetical protein